MKVLTSIDRDEIAALRRKGEFFWLDLERPKEEDLSSIDQLFDLNPLARRQLRAQRQRSKLYLYGEHALIVYWGVSTGSGGPESLAEVHLIVSGDGVISTHQRPCPALKDLRTELESGGGEGPEEFLVYRVLDAMTDAFFPVLETIDNEIDDLEDEVLRKPTDEQLQRISDLKRNLVGLRRVIGAERDLFARAGDDILKIPGLEPGSRDYFRDLYDHLIRLSDMIDSYRDLLTSAMDVYLSTVSNRLNVVMERLTQVATIFLPLTLLTGFFGMNFAWLVRRMQPEWTFWVFGVGGSLLSSVLILLWMRRRDLG